MASFRNFARLAPVSIVVATVMVAASPVAAQEAPFAITDGLYDRSNPATYGLQQPKDAKTFTIVRPDENTNKFNHGIVLLPFKDKLYAQWQTSKLDEDAPETVVVYSVSADGETWSAPRPMTEVWDKGYKSSGGLWTDGETLVAYLNVWPADLKPRGGHVEYITSTDGETWSEPKRVMKSDGTPVNGIFEQDPRAINGGRVISAVHEQPGLIAKPYYTDDPLGVSGWRAGALENLDHAPDITRELEPSSFERRDGSVVMVFRDQGRSFKKLASVSHDRGMTWSQATETNMPDSRSKQSAGNLPDGTAYHASSPTGTRERFPLILTLSGNGHTFDTAYVLRSGDSDLQPRRYEGKFKNPGFSYPKSVVWKDHLYVAYATNKEDVQYTRVPLSSIRMNY